jgi:hypothetical protein
MLREEYLRRLIDGAYVELYLSANDGARLYWPFRMHPPGEATPRYRNACEKYIVDSDPLDDSVTTRDVLDTANRLNAEVASLQDVYLDKNATVDALLEGLEIADDHAFSGALLLPLQAPYVECWKEIGEPTQHLIGIGGLKDSTPEKRLKAAKTLRNAVGEDIWIHGFGWGVEGLAQEIRDNQTLIDSIDYSTPMQEAATDKCTPGEERMSVAAMGAAQKLVRDLREVSEYPTEQTPENLRGETQAGMEAYW